MLELLRHGGPPIWVILLFGIIALVAAVLHAIRPEERRMAFLRAMSVAVVCASFAGFVAGMAKSINGTALLPPHLRDRAGSLILKGTAESMADLILGAALLAVAWFIAAIGVRRQPPPTQ